MGRTIAKKIRGMSLWAKVGLVLTCTLLAGTLLHKVAQSAPTAKGKVVYSINTTTPQYRDYNPPPTTPEFGTQTVLPTGAIPTFMVDRACPTRNEHIAGYVTTTGVLYIYRWNGTSWVNETSAAGGWGGTVTVGGDGVNGRRFDIAYENTTGNAMVVYSTNVATTNELAYRTWNGTTWSAATNINPARIAGVAAWVKLASKPGANEITMGVQDNGSATANTADLTVMTWTGAAWGSEPTASVSTGLQNTTGLLVQIDGFDIAYESVSGERLIAYVQPATTAGIYYRTYIGAALGTATSMAAYTSPAQVILRSDPYSDKILVVHQRNASASIYGLVWSGTAMGASTGLASTSVTPAVNKKPFGAAWLRLSGVSYAVALWQDSASANLIDYRIYDTGSSTWAAAANYNKTVVQAAQWMDVDVDPQSRDTLMLTFSDAAADVYAKRAVISAGPTLTFTAADGGTALSATLTNTTTMNFGFAYDRFVPQVLVSGLADYPATASVTQGQANNAMLKFQLATNAGTATWSGGKLDKTGTNANLGDATFKIYKDTENTGTFTSATDTVIGTGSFSAATGQSYTLSTNQTLNTTNQWYFIVYDVIDTAATATTVGARIADNTYFTADIAMGSVTSTSSTASTINASAVTVSGLASYPPPASVQQADANVPMLKFQLATNYGTATWSGGKLDKTGTNANLGDVTFKIYKDANANGTLEAAIDTMIGTGSYSVATGQSYTLSTNQTITTTASPWYFIAYDIAAAAQTGTTVGGRIADNTYFTLGKGGMNAVTSTSSGTPTINAGTCTAAAPTVTLGTDGTVKPGLNKIYTLSITNNDSVFCGSSTFTIAIGSETGNTGSFVLPSTLGAVSTGALAPGATFNTTFTVLAQSGATEGHALTSAVNVTDAVNHGALPGSDTVITTVATWEDSPLLHNSNRKLPSSAKWASWNFKWGIPGGKYGAFTCATCHVPDATNIKAVRSSITAPFGVWSSSGAANLNVLFRNSTSMGNDLRSPSTSSVNICEACHSRNKYHNYNVAKNTGGTAHNNNKDCTGCHPHGKGFIGEGESSGGSACTSCHNGGNFSTAMKGTGGYHHYMNTTDATTPPTVAQPANMGGAADTNRNCLMCHVDHNFFRPDVNTTNGGRAKNLRADISTAPLVGDPTTYTNADFLNDATKNGGICLSCHRTPQTNMGYTQPDGSTAKIPIPYRNSTTASQVTAYAKSAHGGTYTYASYSSVAVYTGNTYTVTSTFSGTLTNTFVANCVKCHNDTMNPKSGVDGQGASDHKFGNHTTSRPSMLTAFNSITTATKGANFCFKCHGNQPVHSTGTPSNVYLTAGQTQYDWYSSVRMGPRTKNIYADYNDPLLTVKHQVQNPLYVDRHTPSETRAQISANKHVTCDDCHNHHASKPGLHIKGVRNLAPALTGARGVQKPISTAWLPAWSAPVFADELVPVEEEWQVCFKCHSNYNTNLAGWNATWNNVAIEFNPRNPAGHAVIGFSRIPASQTINFKAGSGLTKNSILTCTDCHLSSYDTSKSSIYPSGGHASKNTLLLKGNYDPNLDSRVTTGGPAEMCAVCHDANAYGITALDPGGTTTSGFSNGTNNMHLEHAFRQGIATYKCAECHSARIHGWKRRGMMVLTGDPAPYLQGGSDHVAGWVQNTSAYVQGNCTGGTGACSAHP